MQKKRIVLSILLLFFIQFVHAQNYLSQSEIPSDISYTEIVAALTQPAVVQTLSRVQLTALVPNINTQNGKITLTNTLTKITINDSFTGSGFIVTPDGYIVTNAHNIIPALDDELPFFIQKVMNIMKIQPQDQIYFGNYLQQTIKLNIIPIITNVLLPSTQKSVFTQTIMPAKIKKIGEAYPGKDVAIIKINAQNLPTVNLQNPRAPVGAPVIVIGYPSAANIGIAPNEPTVTSGIVSAYKTASNEFSLIQIDAPISHGSSGGPAFDEKGSVIGIATLEAIEGGGFNWVIPAQIVKEFLDQLGIHPNRSNLDRTYERALVLYWNGYYQDAITKFNQVLTLYPKHPLVPDFIAQSQTLFQQQQNSIPTVSIQNTLLITISILVILIIVFWFHTLTDKHITPKNKKNMFTTSTKQ